MGIPSYFRWIVQHYRRDTIHTQPPFQPIAQLYLDFNCGIHPAAKRHPDSSEAAMFQAILDYLEYLIDTANPTELVYIAIDGVPPVAKMKQQRLRRFKAVKEAMEMNQLKTKYGVPLSKTTKDFNMISPATRFMFQLSQQIQNWIHQKKPIKYSHLQFILTDASVPGEGEQKIMQYLKQQDVSKNVLIYGLDSDLIMLSLILGRDNIALFRETNNFSSSTEISTSEAMPKMSYFLITSLRKHLYEQLTTSNLCSLINHTYSHDIHLIYDYIVLSFFLGNDFIPGFEALKIREGGIDRVLQIYRGGKNHLPILPKETNNSEGMNHPQYLLEDSTLALHNEFKLNLNKLKLIVSALASSEEYDLQKLTETRNQRASNQFNPSTFEEALDQYQAIETSSQDPINCLQIGWQERYYQYLFHLKHVDHIYVREQINIICQQYLTALVWCVQYYFHSGEALDWQWFYPYNYAPLLIDFKQYLDTNPSIPSIQTKDALQPVQQLLMIMPPQSVSLLPTGYHTLLTSDYSSLIQYYPIDFCLETYGKRYRWECHPKIMMIPPNVLTDLIDLPLTGEEQRCVQLGQAIYI